MLLALPVVLLTVDETNSHLANSCRGPYQSGFAELERLKGATSRHGEPAPVFPDSHLLKRGQVPLDVLTLKPVNCGLHMRAQVIGYQQ